MILRGLRAAPSATHTLTSVLAPVTTGSSSPYPDANPRNRLSLRIFPLSGESSRPEVV